MQQKFDVKRKAHHNYKQNSNAEIFHLLRQARNATQQKARECANAYWIELCARIHTDADTAQYLRKYLPQYPRREVFYELAKKRCSGGQSNTRTYSHNNNTYQMIFLPDFDAAGFEGA